MGVQANNTKVIHADEDFAVGYWENIFFVVWYGETTVEAVRRIEEEAHTLAGQNPRGLGLLTVVKEKAKMPPPRARQALADFLSESGDTVRVSAVVQEGAGFRAAAVRGLISGITMVAKQPFPHKIFATIEDASRWFEKIAGEQTDWLLSTGIIMEAMADFLLATEPQPQKNPRKKQRGLFFK